MSIASFFAKLFKKEKNGVSREEQLWIELTVPEDAPILDKKILNALAGKTSPLEAETAFDEFIGYGWERIKKDVYEMAVGKKVCLPTYFERIVKAFPEDAENLLQLCFEEMLVSHRLVYLATLGEKNAVKMTEEVIRLLPSLEKEELGAAFAALSANPTEKGLTAIASYLNDENWKLRMKAAAALADAHAKNYIPSIMAAAEACDGPISAGLKEIAGRMEVS